MDGVRRWFGRGAAAKEWKSSRRETQAAEATMPTGMVMAAVALLCLGIGFSLGRFLPGRQEVDLNRPEATGPRRPGPIDAGKGALPAEKETEQLSTVAFELLRFYPSQRSEAARAAEYLRAHGVDTARIQRSSTKAVANIWVVFAYVPSPDQAEAVLAKLKAVPSSSSWPKLKEKIQSLTPNSLHPF